MGFGKQFMFELLSFAFDSGASPAKTNTYIALSIADPTNNASGFNEVIAPVTNGYDRWTMNNTTSWTITNADPVSMSNAAAVTFGESTNPWNASAIGWVAIFDSPTLTAEANFIAHGPLATNRTVNSAGITLQFDAGQLDIQSDDTNA